MAQNNTAWPTYTDVIEQLGVAGIPVRAGTANAYYTKEIDRVVNELESKTHRQFIKDSSDTTRKFDGSGTGEQYVDDMVSLTTVTVSGWVGIASFDITGAVLLEEKTYPRNKIVMAEGPPFQYTHGVFVRFPEGRQNISVTGIFGFGTYIPDRVWMAVRDMASAKMAAQFLADSNTGRILKSWIEGASSEKYIDGDLKQIGEAQGWIQEFRQVKLDYLKPVNDQFKRKRSGMI